LRHLLIFLWLAGLGSGLFFSFLAGSVFDSISDIILDSSMAFPAFVSSQLLPLLLSTVLLYASKPVFLFPLVFLKGFSFSFVSFLILSTLGASGWLVRVLLMFSDLLLIPVLWWFWLNSFSDNKRLGMQCVIITVCAVFSVCFFDFTVIAPFLVSLL